MKFVDIKKNYKGVNETVEVKIGDDIVFNVKQYIPIKEKATIITQACYASLFDGVVDSVYAEMIFNLYLIYAATDIVFTAAQKEKAWETYDILEKTGIINATIDALPAEEYDKMISFLTRNIEMLVNYQASLGPLLQKIEAFLPTTEEGLEGGLNANLEDLATMQEEAKTLFVLPDKK